MKLAAYMLKEQLTPQAMADVIGDCSASGVVKWARDERVPRPDQQRRIFDVTNGEVTPNDFALTESQLARIAGDEVAAARQVA